MTFPQDLRELPETAPTTTYLRRRGLLQAGGLSLLTATAAGCNAFSTKPTSSQPGTRGVSDGSQMKNSQAPALAAQVKAGKLPALKDRLPASPIVVTPVDSVGQYGGSWRTSLPLAEAAYVSLFIAGYDPLVRWSAGWPAKPKTVEPNIAESFQVSSDATTFTFHLRNGLRWSDGQPFTADDLVFAVDDVMLNTELNPVAPPLIVDPVGKPGKIEKVDDYTVRYTFQNPYGLFPSLAATGNGIMLVNYPMHYCKKFHKKYTADVNQVAKKNGFQDWVAQFQKVCDYTVGSPELPTIWAWQVTVPVGKGTDIVLERNPYYWKTDPQGNQLPYLDGINIEIIEDENTLLLKAESGDINLEAGPATRFTTSENKPVLATNRQRGGYKFLGAINTRSNVMVITFNLTHKDPVKREIFTNKDFRIGLSYAINRPEVIKATMQRQGKPYQVASLPDSDLYDETFGTQYTDYSVAMANQHLDSAGLKKSSSGARLGPDGKPITFTMEYVADHSPAWPDIMNLIKGYWQQVGINMVLRNEDQSVWTTRTSANQHDATVWQGDGGLDEIMVPRFYFPYDSQSFFATPWAEWFISLGKSGQEPPAAPKRQMQLYNMIKSTADTTQQNKYMKEILDISKEQFYCIGVARETQRYFIESTKFRNVPDPIIQSPATYPTVGATYPEQYYLVS